MRKVHLLVATAALGGAGMLSTAASALPVQVLPQTGGYLQARIVCDVFGRCFRVDPYGRRFFVPRGEGFRGPGFGRPFGDDGFGAPRRGGFGGGDGDPGRGGRGRGDGDQGQGGRGRGDGDQGQGGRGRGDGDRGDGMRQRGNGDGSGQGAGGGQRRRQGGGDGQNDGGGRQRPRQNDGGDQ